MQQSRKPAVHGPKSTNTSIKGDYWEYYAAIVALEKGAEVYRNMCCVGPIDMVLRINGEIVLVDVKVKAWDEGGQHFRANHGATIPEGVYGVAVDPSTKRVSWYNKHGMNTTQKRFRCPPGLEDFWDETTN